jgi:catechol 2,3-dioxygenase-like lactoylglutathione lyase family enzyme
MDHIALDHASCVYRSAEAADRVLGDCLGMHHLRTFTLAAEAAGALFLVDRATEVMVFGTDRRLLEAIILPDHRTEGSAAHICVTVEDLVATLRRCRTNGLEVRSTTVGDHDVFFVADADGNLFELKQG